MDLNPWSLALGIVVVGVLGYYVVPALFEHVRKETLKQLKDGETVRPLTSGGDILGHLECVIFFVSFVWPGAIVLAPSWLAFKTAAKWKAWVTAAVNPAEAAVMYRLFLVGTAANIVAALVGAAVTQIP